MIKILGIDYGLKKVGLAISESFLVQPYMVIKYENEEELFRKLQQIIEKEKIEKIVIGISEGEMGEKTKQFVKSLKLKVKIPVEKFDETLSTYDAQRLTIEIGMKRSKRRNMEDAYAAAVMLQNYIDANGN